MITYVFVCHDDASVENSLKRLPEAKIMFVGPKHLTIKDERITVVRDLPHHIEHERHLLTFTAWYAIVKNNLYSDFVCIMEHDVEISPGFVEEVKNTIIQHGATDVVTFHTLNYWFDEPYTPFLKKYIEKKGKPYDMGAYWYPTTNHCVRRSLLTEFVEWYYPFCLGIKMDDPACFSWYHERLFSVFLTTHRKHVVCKDNLLRHVQICSHIDFQKQPQKYFITYGNDVFEGSKARIIKEAESFGLFTKCIPYGPDDMDEEFVRKNSHILSEKRGGGYWIWKPYVCMKTLQEMNHGDILLYCDAGCTLQTGGMVRMKEYLEIVRKNDSSILAFQMDAKEQHWNKRDLIDHLCAFDCVNDGQVAAGTFFIRKCKNSMDMIEKWLLTVQEKHLVDDSPSLAPNFFGFREHRHDQACFSLLVKQYRATLLEDEVYGLYWHPPGNINVPIWVTRMKSQPVPYGKDLVPTNHEYGNVLTNHFHHFVALQNIMAQYFDQWRGCGSYLINGQSLYYDPSTFEKQNVFFQASRKARNALEIGVHGAHSLFIMLLSNPIVKITCIDICHWDHTEKCVAYLNLHYNNRITLLKGSSVDILPTLRQDFDFIHIDGDHSYEGFLSDLRGSYKLSSSETVFVIDDFIHQIYDAFQQEKDKFIIITLPSCAWRNCLAIRSDRVDKENFIKV